MWVTTSPPPCGRGLPCTIRSSPAISPSPPLTRSPAATPESRSDSFTRNSWSPRMTVVPSAKLAATASTGYSSIIAGARAAGTPTPRDAAQRRRPPPEIGHLFAAVAAGFERFDVGAHRTQGRDQPRAQRVGHHIGEDDVRPRHDQRGHQGEGGG